MGRGGPPGGGRGGMRGGPGGEGGDRGFPGGGRQQAQQMGSRMQKNAEAALKGWKKFWRQRSFVNMATSSSKNASNTWVDISSVNVKPNNGEDVFNNEMLCSEHYRSTAKDFKTD